MHAVRHTLSRLRHRLPSKGTEDKDTFEPAAPAAAGERQAEVKCPGQPWLSSVPGTATAVPSQQRAKTPLSAQVRQETPARGDFSLVRGRAAPRAAPPPRRLRSDWDGPFPAGAGKDPP